MAPPASDGSSSTSAGITSGLPTAAPPHGGGCSGHSAGAPLPAPICSPSGSVVVSSGPNHATSHANIAARTPGPTATSFPCQPGMTPDSTARGFGRVRGCVTDQHGAPVAHAPVVLEVLTPGVPLPAIGRQTTADGRFVASLDPASYRIWISLPSRNYQSPVQQLTIRVGEAVTLIFVITLANG